MDDPKIEPGTLSDYVKELKAQNINSSAINNLIQRALTIEALELIIGIVIMNLIPEKAYKPMVISVFRSLENHYGKDMEIKNILSLIKARMYSFYDITEETRTKINKNQSKVKYLYIKRVLSRIVKRMGSF